MRNVLFTSDYSSQETSYEYIILPSATVQVVDLVGLEELLCTGALPLVTWRSP